jgi:hypothetical protein
VEQQKFNQLKLVIRPMVPNKMVGFTAKGIKHATTPLHSSQVDLQVFVRNNIPKRGKAIYSTQ